MALLVDLFNAELSHRRETAVDVEIRDCER